MSISDYPMTISNETDGSIIVIGITEPKADIEPTPDEKAALKIIYTAISEIGIAPNEIALKQISKNYLTIFVNGPCDFCRLKIGPKTKWFSLAFSPQDEPDLRTDSRLASVKDKNIRHWKIPLSSIDELKEYTDLIQKACLFGKNFG